MLISSFDNQVFLRRVRSSDGAFTWIVDYGTEHRLFSFAEIALKEFDRCCGHCAACNGWFDIPKDSE